MDKEDQDNDLIATVKDAHGTVLIMYRPEQAKIEKLPEAAKQYLKRIEALIETPVAMVSVSPQRGRTIQVKDVLATPDYDDRYPRNARR